MLKMLILFSKHMMPRFTNPCWVTWIFISLSNFKQSSSPKIYLIDIIYTPNYPRVSFQKKSYLSNGQSRCANPCCSKPAPPALTSTHLQSNFGRKLSFWYLDLSRFVNMCLLGEVVSGIGEVVQTMPFKEKLLEGKKSHFIDDSIFKKQSSPKNNR